jgi:RNA polymerase-binding protein DksA
VAKTNSKKRNTARAAHAAKASSKPRPSSSAAVKVRPPQRSSPVVAPARRAAKAPEVKLARTSVETTSVKKSAHVMKAPPPPQILPSPVPTDGKPRKNQAGFNSRELEYYRSLLLAKRRELVGDMSSMEREALRSASGSNLSNLPIHMADMGTDNYEQEFTLGLVEKDRQLLREINAALAKIQNGTYGICEGTGKPISKPRLEAQPWAKYSIEYARELEKGGVRR